MLPYHQPTPQTTGSPETWTQHSVSVLWSLHLRWMEKFHSNYTMVTQLDRYHSMNKLYNAKKLILAKIVTGKTDLAETGKLSATCSNSSYLYVINFQKCPFFKYNQQSHLLVATTPHCNMVMSAVAAALAVDKHDWKFSVALKHFLYLHSQHVQTNRSHWQDVLCEGLVCMPS